MAFEDDFKNAFEEGKAHGGSIAAYRKEWVGALREKMVLRVFRQAQLYLGEKECASEAYIINETEVYFRCTGHELKFDFDNGTGTISCRSSIQSLNETYDPKVKVLNTFRVEAKLIAFGRVIGALAG